MMLSWTSLLFNFVLSFTIVTVFNVYVSIKSVFILVSFILVSLGPLAATVAQ